MDKKEPRLFSSNIRSKFSIAKDLLFEYGGKYFLRFILPWFFARRYFFYLESLRAIAPAPPARAPLQLDLLTEQDFSELISLRPYYYNHSILKKRIKDGHLGFIGRSNKKLIHVRWMFRNSVYLPYLHRTLVLSSEEIFADDAYTVPEYRHKGIFAQAGYLLRTKLREMGYRRYSYVYASWQAMAKKPAKHIRPHKVGELKITKWPWQKKYHWQGAIQELGQGKIRIG